MTRLPNVRIDVVAFAQARDALGAGHLELDLPAGSRVSDALAALAGAYPALAPLAPHLAIAIDRQLARGERELTDGCELALLPPVSGG
jgi:molybdopterin converting factor small subunit